jgi:hypothetical protein
MFSKVDLPQPDGASPARKEFARPFYKYRLLPIELAVAVLVRK